MDYLGNDGVPVSLDGLPPPGRKGNTVQLTPSFYSMLKCYERKFPKSNVIRPFKAITYFDDVDFNESIIILSGTYDWKHIEKRRPKMVGKQDKIFESFPLKKKSVSPRKGNGLKL